MTARDSKGTTPPPPIDHKAEHERAATELVRVRQELARAEKKAREAEARAEKAAASEGNARRALADLKKVHTETVRDLARVGEPLIATEAGELFVVLKHGALVGSEHRPMGTPVARVVLLNGATLNYVVDGWRSGVLTERAATSVAKKGDSDGGDADPDAPLVKGADKKDA